MQLAIFPYYSFSIFFPLSFHFRLCVLLCSSLFYFFVGWSQSFSLNEKRHSADCRVWRFAETVRELSTGSAVAAAAIAAIAATVPSTAHIIFESTTIRSATKFAENAHIANAISAATRFSTGKLLLTVLNDRTSRLNLLIVYTAHNIVPVESKSCCGRCHSKAFHGRNGKRDNAVLANKKHCIAISDTGATISKAFQ